MSRVSTGALNKKNRGGPTDDHEQLIDMYVDSGFSRYGFTLFLKAAVLNSVSDFKVDLKSLYESISGMQQKDVFNCRLKRLVKKQEEAIPELIEVDGEYIENKIYCDWASFSVGEFKSLFRERWCVIPDCWRIDANGDFQIIEVKDSSEVPFSKLYKLCEMDDLLFNLGLGRVFVFEHHIASDGVVKHDLNIVWDMCEFDFYRFGNNDRELLREYTKMMRCHDKGFGEFNKSDIPTLSVSQLTQKIGAAQCNH